jgi:hypothetical protein
MSRVRRCCAVAVAAGVFGSVSGGAHEKAPNPVQVVVRYEDATFAPIDPERPDDA